MYSMVPLKEYQQCRVFSLERGLCYIEILSDVYGNVGHVVVMCPSSCYQGGAPAVCDQFRVDNTKSENFSQAQT